MGKKEFTVREKLNNLSVLADSVSAKSGWSKLKAIREMNKSRKQLGVPYVIYDRYSFFKHSMAEQEELFRVFTEQEEKQVLEHKAKVKEAKEKAILTVMNESGWDRKTTASAIKKAKKELGVSPSHYLAYRFWEVDEDKQKTYFTKGDSIKLKNKYNDDFQGKSKMSNKDAFNRFFAEFIGRKWIESACSFEEFYEKFAGEPKVIYKPIGLSGGTGIKVFDLTGTNSHSEDALRAAYEEISSLDEGIVESFIVQHHEMAKLSKNSVNTIRVVSIMTHDKKKGIEPDEVHILYAGLRMGRGESVLDNLHAGGLIAGIDMKTGIVDTAGVDYENNVYEKHPDTGQMIRGFEIPFFDQILEMIKKAGKEAEGYFGWDVAITESRPILIEANTSPGAGILQIPYAVEKKGMKHVVEKYL